MGVATLIAVMTIVQGANLYVEQKIANLGTNVFQIARTPFAVTDFNIIIKALKYKKIELEDMEAVAEGLGWTLRAEIHRAVSWGGQLLVDDPDGIVIDARFVPFVAALEYLEDCAPWVREPLGAWLVERWEAGRAYRYRLDGNTPGSITVVKV